MTGKRNQLIGRTDWRRLCQLSLGLARELPSYYRARVLAEQRVCLSLLERHANREMDEFSPDGCNFVRWSHPYPYSYKDAEPGVPHPGWVGYEETNVLRLWWKSSTTTATLEAWKDGRSWKLIFVGTDRPGFESSYALWFAQAVDPGSVRVVVSDERLVQRLRNGGAGSKWLARRLETSRMLISQLPRYGRGGRRHRERRRAPVRQHRM